MQQSPLFTPRVSKNIFNRPGITKLTSVLKKDDQHINTSTQHKKIKISITDIFRFSVSFFSPA